MAQLVACSAFVLKLFQDLYTGEGFAGGESSGTGVLGHSPTGKVSGQVFWTIPERGKLPDKWSEPFTNGESFRMLKKVKSKVK